MIGWNHATVDCDLLLSSLKTNLSLCSFLSAVRGILIDYGDCMSSYVMGDAIVELSREVVIDGYMVSTSRYLDAYLRGRL
jgi:predicted membrane-bound spermidine synthase